MSIFDQFLNKTGESGAGFSLVNASNPVQWSKLAQGIFAGTIGMIILGLQWSIDALLAAPARLVSGVTDWITKEGEYRLFPWGIEQVEPAGLIPTVRDGLLDIVFAAWQPFTGLGWLSWPVALATLLLSMYAIVWSLAYVREEVF